MVGMYTCGKKIYTWFLCIPLINFSVYLEVTVVVSRIKKGLLLYFEG